MRFRVGDLVVLRWASLLPLGGPYRIESSGWARREADLPSTHCYALRRVLDSGKLDRERVIHSVAYVDEQFDPVAPLDGSGGAPPEPGRPV